jgi:phosphoglycerate dehydrogenase-like enzyme
VEEHEDARPADAGDVLITWPDYDIADERLGGALEQAGLRIRLAPKHGARSEAELRALLNGAAAAIVSTDPFDALTFRAHPALRVVARVGVGVDSIDLAAATAAGVAVTVTPGANDHTVADHAVALMLACLRRVVEHDAGVRRGAWNRTGDHTPWVLTGATVGLIGYGRIGRLVAERLRGFGARILVTDPVAVPDAGEELVELPDLLAAADVVSLHAPLLPSTRLLIGAAELRRMRPTAILVNTARGAVIDEAALARALAHGELRGAALDVFGDEPPDPASPLLSLPNVVLSPHIAGLSDQSIEQMLRRATASVLDVLAGRAPADLANPEVLAASIGSRA